MQIYKDTEGKIKAIETRSKYFVVSSHKDEFPKGRIFATEDLLIEYVLDTYKYSNVLRNTLNKRIEEKRNIKLTNLEIEHNFMSNEIVSAILTFNNGHQVFVVDRYDSKYSNKLLENSHYISSEEELRSKVKEIIGSMC